MTDFNIARNPDESESLHACRYLLARMSANSDYAWHMLDTEALRLCVAAVAAADGVDVDVLADEVSARACRQIQHEKPKIEQLRAKLEDMQDDIDLKELDAKLSEPSGDELRLWAVEDLLNHCQLTGRQPTVDALAKAVAGASLDAAIVELS